MAVVSNTWSTPPTAHRAAGVATRACRPGRWPRHVCDVTRLSDPLRSGRADVECVDGQDEPGAAGRVESPDASHRAPVEDVYACTGLVDLDSVLRYANPRLTVMAGRPTAMTVHGPDGPVRGSVLLVRNDVPSSVPV